MFQTETISSYIPSYVRPSKTPAFQAVDAVQSSAQHMAPVFYHEFLSLEPEGHTASRGPPNNQILCTCVSNFIYPFIGSPLIS